MVDLEELKAKALAATPGPWWIDSHGHTMISEDNLEVIFHNDNSARPAVRHDSTGNLSHWRNDCDASYIAAANPVVTLELIERLQQAETERDALKAELDRLPAKWSEDSSLKTWFPITCDYLDSLRAEMDELKAKLKSTESRLHEVAVGCANAEFELEAARKQEPCGYMCEDACITTIYNAAKCTGDFSKHTPVYKSPVPAQQAESPWHVITNENWNIPKLGQRVILFSNGVIQNDSYTLDRGDDGYFWSRDDVDECPEVKAGDAWMPWPSEFRGVE